MGGTNTEREIQRMIKKKDRKRDTERERKPGDVVMSSMRRSVTLPQTTRLTSKNRLR